MFNSTHTLVGIALSRAGLNRWSSHATATAVVASNFPDVDSFALFDRYRDFSIEVVQRTRGLKLKIKNAPACAFVDGRIIEGVRQHLFAVLRDLIYIGTEIERSDRFDLGRGDNITDAVFHILKHARVLDPDLRPNLVVCWGGHAVSRTEYDYTKGVGYHMGLRGLDVCTGCGPGAMKGPMKGAAIGHAKQRLRDARYLGACRELAPSKQESTTYEPSPVCKLLILGCRLLIPDRLLGLTEPEIIAAEPPNAIVNHLIVLPDIEKRLEAFVRIGHGVIVFPGGVGTAEEILYLLGVLTDPANADQYLPVVFTGPKESRDYFEGIDHFIAETLGDEARDRYLIIIDDAPEVARHMARMIREVRAQRRKRGDAFYFNWLLNGPEDYQRPFEVSHEAVANLVLHRDLPTHELAANLRHAFSAIVTGNVKEHGIRLIRRYGPFEIHGDRAIMGLLDTVLGNFVDQGRMKIAKASYEPCYRVVTS